MQFSALSTYRHCASRHSSVILIRMSAVVLPIQPSRNRALVCFALLQLADLTTTLAVFSRGGYELNPVIRGLMPFTGPVLAVLARKTLLFTLVWRFSRRNWILYFGNALYAAIVSWNLLCFLIAP